MDEKDKLRLRGNFRYIVGQIRVGDIRDYLFEKGILNDDDFEELEPGRQTERNNVRTLLKILFKKGPNAYGEFCAALIESGYDYVVKKLTDTDPDNVPIETQDQLDSFLKEEGQFVELQRKLWKTTEMLDHYKREFDAAFHKLKSENEELKNSRDDMKSKYAELETSHGDMRLKYTELEENIKKGVTEQDIVQYLDEYMHKAQLDTPDCEEYVGNVDWARRPSLPTKRHSGAKDQVSRIAMQLGDDIVDFLALPPESIPPEPNRYARTLRRTVALMMEKQADNFHDFIEKMQFTEDNGFEMLRSIMDEMFRVGEHNWGRVVVLYAFGGFVAKHAYQNQMHSTAKYLGHFIGKYVATNLSSWIEEKGGWDDFEHFFEEMNDQSLFGWKSLFLTAISLGALVCVASVRGSQ